MNSYTENLQFQIRSPSHLFWWPLPSYSFLLHTH